MLLYVIPTGTPEFSDYLIVLSNLFSESIRRLSSGHKFESVLEEVYVFPQVVNPNYGPAYTLVTNNRLAKSISSYVGLPYAEFFEGNPSKKIDLYADAIKAACRQMPREHLPQADLDVILEYVEQTRTTLHANDRTMPDVRSIRQWTFAEEWIQKIKAFGWPSTDGVRLKDEAEQMDDPFGFYLLEPLVSRSAFVAVAERRTMEELAIKAPSVVPQPETEFGELAKIVLSDLLLFHRNDIGCQIRAVTSSLLLFLQSGTGRSVLAEVSPPFPYSFGSMVLYVNAKDNCISDMAMRPSGGEIEELLFSKNEIMAYSFGFIRKDLMFTPELRSRFPIDEYTHGVS